MESIQMPAGGQTTNESLITVWHKQIGDKIVRGDLLFDMETDKATLSVESYCEGWLRAIVHVAGEKVSAGEAVAYIGAMDEALPGETATEALKATNEDDEYQSIMRGTIAQKTIHKAEPAQPANPERITPLASPLARKTARDHGLSLRDIAPSQGGIIKQQDVLAHLSGAVKAAPEEDGTLIPVSAMRGTIARRMLESVSTAPQYTVTVEIDMTECVKLRAQLMDTAKIAYHDILAKCVARAVASFPMINASFEGAHIRMHKNIHFGFAVGVENGLVVPVIRDVQTKTLSEIAAENRENIRLARAGALPIARMTGGTLTISNLGMYGVAQFTAILNQPESCILAMGEVAEKAVSIGGVIVSRQQMTLTASFDHRVIDGAVGAAFLKEVKALMENPYLLLI